MSTDLDAIPPKLFYKQSEVWLIEGILALEEKIPGKRRWPRVKPE